MSTTRKPTKRSKSTATRRKPSARKGKAIDRPFDAAILRKAKKLANQYRLVIEPDIDVGFMGSSVEFPYVCGDGETLSACVENTIEATTLAIATMLEQGERPPSPASSGKRETQVNIRLSADEKLRLEEAARKEGFRSLSDFMRTAALGRAT